MKKFEQIVEQDPLKLEQYDTGSSAKKTSKILYTLMAASAGLLVLGLVMWGLGSLTDIGDLPTRGSSADSDSADKIDIDSSSAVLADDGTEIVPSANKTGKPVVIIGEVFTDRKKVADSFSKI